MRVLAFIFGLCVLSGAACASDIEIKAAWSRATAPGQNIGVAYFEIVNHGGPDVLRGAQVEGVGQAMLHRSANDNGVMTMRGLDDGLGVGAQKTVSLQPGGDHLMLMGLTKALRQGDELRATLEFDHAGKIEVKIPVLAIGATGPKP